MLNNGAKSLKGAVVLGVGGGGLSLLSRKDQLSRQEEETALRHVMEGASSSGNGVKFIMFTHSSLAP